MFTNSNWLGNHTINILTISMLLFLLEINNFVGVKFVITASPGTTELTEFLHAIYEIYADYVLKV